jgi:hypothetical protein
MTCRLGPLQRLLLAALRRHGRNSSLRALTALAAGFATTLDSPLPDRVPSRARYVSVARAVAALKRRGFVETELVGVAHGKIEWLPPRAGRLRSKWRFQHPTTRLSVRLVTAPEETHEHEIRN